MPKLRKVGLELFDAPPAQFLNEKILPCSAERLFEILADTPGWSAWFDDMKSGTWTSAPPFGVGSTRRMVLGATTVDETILVWEPGRRFSFVVDTMGLPLVRAMAEDLRIEPHGDNACKLIHHVAYEPTLLARLVHPLIRKIFGGQFKRTLDKLEAFVART